MVEKGTGAALVIDDELPTPCDRHRARPADLGRRAARTPTLERVADHMSEGVLTAAPDWSLERAAAEMSRRDVRHLVVFDGRRADRRPLDARHRPLLDQRRGDVGNEPAAGLRRFRPGAAPRSVSRPAAPRRESPGGAAGGSSRGSSRGRCCGRRRGATIAPMIAQMQGEKMKPAAKMPQTRPTAPSGEEDRAPRRAAACRSVSPGSGTCRCSAIVLLGDVEEGGDEAEGEDRRRRCPRRPARRSCSCVRSRDPLAGFLSGRGRPDAGSDVGGDGHREEEQRQVGEGEEVGAQRPAAVGGCGSRRTEK